MGELDHDRSADSGGWASTLVRYHAAIVGEASTLGPPADDEAGRDTDVARARACLQALEDLRHAQGAVALDGSAEAEPYSLSGRAGERPPPPESPELPESRHPQESSLRLGRFTDLQEVGRGGHGVVYRAWDPHLERHVALKVPRIETIASRHLRERFLREARAVALLDHPHLAVVHEVGEAGPACYIASQFCSGPTLASWRRSQTGPIPPALAARIIATLAETAAYVHRHGIVHRDLKPANVLLEPAAADAGAADDFPFVLKLADFGLARLDDAPEATWTGAILGTPGYMAPEQAEGRRGDIGPATDVYALGVMLYELLTGRRPIEGSSDVDTLRRISEGEFPRTRALRPDVPRDLEAVCLACLEREPGRRYQTAAILAEDLHRFLRGEPVSVHVPGRVRRLVKWARRKPVTAGLSAALVVSTVLGMTGVIGQWRAAERHRQQSLESFRHAHEAVREFKDALYASDDFDAPEFQPLRQELLQAAMKYYREFLDHPAASQDRALRVDVADAWYQRASVAETLGDRSEATRCYEQALTRWEALAAEEPEVAEHRYFLARVCDQLAQRFSAERRLAEAAELAQRSLALREDLCAQHPDHAGYQDQLAFAYFGLATVYNSQQNREAALSWARKAEAIWARQAARFPENAWYRLKLASTKRQISSTYYRMRRLPEALSAAEESRELLDSEELQDSSEPRRSRAMLDYFSGRILLRLDRIEEACLALERAYEVLLQIVAEQPEFAGRRVNLAKACEWSGLALHEAGRLEEARARLVEGCRIREELVREFPETASHVRALQASCKLLEKVLQPDNEADQDLLQKYTDLLATLEPRP